MLNRTFVILCAAALLTVTSEAGQQKADTRAGDTKDATLTGCVSGVPVSGEFTFSDSESGSQYRLTGKSMRKFAGQRVEIVGGPRGKRLAIRGGLWPSPNVAAQAGALDPAQAGVATQPGGGGTSATAPLPEFHVIRVRGLEGSCR